MSDPDAGPSLPGAFAVLVAGLCAGRTSLEPKDAAGMQMLRAMIALGARSVPDDPPCQIDGVGNGCLVELRSPLTITDPIVALLLSGLLGAYAMQSTIVCPTLAADDRQLDRLAGALQAMGCQIDVDALQSGCRVTIHGAPCANPWRHQADGWSAITVAAIMAAALNTPGVCRIEGVACDMTEMANQLCAVGANITITPGPDGYGIAIVGQPSLRVMPANGSKP